MIPFVKEMEFEYGRTDQVSPLIRRVVAKNPGPFTYFGTGTYIVGKGEVAVIDPGPDQPEHLEALLGELEGETVRAILLTHHHADHSPLAAPLKAKTGATVYGCPLGHSLDASAETMEAGNDTHFAVDQVICGGGEISGPGWTLEAIPTPGHTSNHVCFALREENALFSGDHIMGWSTTVVTPPDGDMSDYYASLDLIAARKFSTLWPTHGPPITDPAPFIAAYKAHRRGREAQILEQLSAGQSHVKAMVPVMYASVDPRLHPAASMSVLAHMLHMVRSGEVVTDDPAPGLDSAYRLPG